MKTAAPLRAGRRLRGPGRRGESSLGGSLGSSPRPRRRPPPPPPPSPAGVPWGLRPGCPVSPLSSHSARPGLPGHLLQTRMLPRGRSSRRPRPRARARPRPAVSLCFPFALSAARDGVVSAFWHVRLFVLPDSGLHATGCSVSVFSFTGAPRASIRIRHKNERQPKPAGGVNEQGDVQGRRPARGRVGGSTVRPRGNRRGCDDALCC